MTQVKAQTRHKKRKVFFRHWQLYVFLLIPVIWLLVFKYYPMLGAQIAFRKFNPNGGIWGSPWVGFDNFIKFFSSYQFSRVMVNTLVTSFYSLVAGFPLPIILALMLNSLRSKRFKNTLETIAYVPHFISIVVLVGMMMQMLNPHIGILGAIFRMFGQSAPDLFGSAEAFPHLYVWSGIWQNVGWNTIIYTAALSGVDPTLYDAAAVDGAGRFRRVLHVTLPCILPTIIIMFILRVGQFMTVGYDKILLLYNSSIYETADVISTFVYRKGIVESNFSFSAAVGVFNSLVNFVLVVVVNKISAKVSETSLW